MFALLTMLSLGSADCLIMQAGPPLPPPAVLPEDLSRRTLDKTPISVRVVDPEADAAAQESNKLAEPAPLARMIATALTPENRISIAADDAGKAANCNCRRNVQPPTVLVPARVTLWQRLFARWARP